MTNERDYLRSVVEQIHADIHAALSATEARVSPAVQETPPAEVCETCGHDADFHREVCGCCDGYDEEHTFRARPTASGSSETAERESVCSRCGGVNPTPWHAPSPLWNAVMRRDDGLPEYGFCCPRCFIEVAQERGIGGSWHLGIDGQDYHGQPSPDGRVWDAARCLWIEPEPVSPPPVELPQPAKCAECGGDPPLTNGIRHDSHAVCFLSHCGVSHHPFVREPVEAGVELPDEPVWDARTALYRFVDRYQPDDATKAEYMRLCAIYQRAIASQAAAEEREKWERRVDQAARAAEHQFAEVTRLREALTWIRENGLKRPETAVNVARGALRDRSESREASASTEAK